VRYGGAGGPHGALQVEVDDFAPDLFGVTGAVAAGVVDQNVELAQGA
jgi:hypothetical protein